ncbi:MAG TPA: MCP four helix bundle domain-containing protein, partial [Candidatus Competibacter sp.]|nr:MCP four helix bundle domain-containing protein [Candidatus Competibacter sp.]
MAQPLLVSSHAVLPPQLQAFDGWPVFVAGTASRNSFWSKPMNIINLKIGTRLILGFGAMAVIALLLGLLAVFGIHALGSDIENVGENRIPALQALAQLNYQRMTIRAQTQAVFMHEAEADIKAGLQSIQKERQKSWQQVDRWWEALLKIPRTSEKGRALQQQLNEQYKAWRTIYAELDGLIERLIATNDPDQKHALYVEYRQMVGRIVPISDAMGQTFDAITENNTVRTNEMVAESHVTATRLEVLSIAAMAGGIILSVLLTWLLTRVIRRPIGGEPAEMAALTAQIARGDLTVQFANTGKETGIYAAMRDMAAQLKDMVGKVTQSTDTVNSTAAE